jgi:26S proteasome regulatory subunit N9
LEFLTTFVTKLKAEEKAKDAYVLILSESVVYKLLLNQLEQSKEDLKEAEAILEKLPQTDPTINASYYRVSADYYKVTKGYQQYYHNALLFLSSINVDELLVKEKQDRAFDLCMSALLGEGLYNFGELVISN